MRRYQDQYFWYVWKPHGMPSSWGDGFCVLDELMRIKDNEEVGKNENEERLARLVSGGYDVFGREGELGMVNRLDNATAGLLYFAKSADVFARYKTMQGEGRVVKTYLADVWGRVDDVRMICTPIMHHRHLSDRMVAWRGFQDNGKVRGKKLCVETYIEPISYDSERNITTIVVMIMRGVRHQIRVHCASIGCPLAGDVLYGKRTENNVSQGALCLWSVGVQCV